MTQHSKFAITATGALFWPLDAQHLVDFPSPDGVAPGREKTPMSTGDAAVVGS